MPPQAVGLVLPHHEQQEPVIKVHSQVPPVESARKSYRPFTTTATEYLKCDSAAGELSREPRNGIVKDLRFWIVFENLCAGQRNTITKVRKTRPRRRKEERHKHESHQDEFRNCGSLSLIVVARMTHRQGNPTARTFAKVHQHVMRELPPALDPRHLSYFRDQLHFFMVNDPRLQPQSHWRLCREPAPSRRCPRPPS